MAERESILSLVLRLNGWKEGSAEAERFTKKFDELRGAGKDVRSALQEAASAIDETGEAERRIVAASSQVVAVLERVGETAVETGQSAAAAARQQADAVEEVVAAAQGERAAVQAAGQEAVESAGRAEAAQKDLAAAFVAVATEVRQSKATLESQREALTAYEARLDKIATGYRASTDASRAHAEAAKVALTDVRKHLQDVETEIRKVETSKAFDTLTFEVKSADDAFENAVVALKNIQVEIESTGTVSARAIPKAAQAVENYRSVVLAAAGTIDGARAEEIARLDQLEAHLLSATAAANRLTNAGRDTAVGLQETGNQIGSVAFAAQDLARFAGPAGERLGNLAAQGGILAVNIEQAKDALEGLNINQLGAARGAAGLAAQYGAVIATILAAITAGKKLSETNAENAESWTDIKDAVSDVLPTLEQAKDRLGAVQSEIAKQLANDSAFENYVTALTFGLNKLVFAEDALAVAIRRGGEARNAYYNLINAGFSAVEAEAAALDDARNTEEAYTKAKLAGVEGMKLWDAAVRASGGSAERLAQILPDTIAKIDGMAEATRKAAEAAKYFAEAQKTAGSATADNEAVTQKALETSEQYEQAVNGTTANINKLLDAIAATVAAGDGYEIGTRRLAEALGEVLANTGKLTAEQRANIEAARELASRAGELTDAEKRHLAELIKVIESGNAHTLALRDQAKATDDLNIATRALTGSEIEAQRADEVRASGIRSQIELLDQLIARAEREEEQTRSSAEANQYAGASVEFLRMKREQLAREEETQLTVWHASEQATRDASAARDEHVAAIDNEIRAGTDLEGINRRVRASEDGLRESLTNLTPAQREATAAAVAAAGGADKVRLSADDAAAAMEKFRTPFVLLPGNARDLASALPDVDQHIKNLADNAARAADSMERLNRAVADGKNVAAGAAQ